MGFESLLLEMNEIMHQLLSRRKERALGGFADITASHLFYVEAIYRLKSPTITELAEHLHVSKASTTLALQKLVKKGLVTKTQSADDRRMFNVTLTKKGLRLVETELKALREITGRLKALLTAQEVEQMTAVLQKIVAHYKG